MRKRPAQRHLMRQQQQQEKEARWSIKKRKAEEREAVMLQDINVAYGREETRQNISENREERRQKVRGRQKRY